MHNIIDEHGDFVIPVDEKFSEGKDHAWLLQKAINGIRFQETHPDIITSKEMVWGNSTKVNSHRGIKTALPKKDFSRLERAHKNAPTHLFPLRLSFLLCDLCAS